MISHWSTLLIFVAYLVLTVLLGVWEARRVKSSRDYTASKMSMWRAATFLAGFTLGGASTYGIAGDTVKFGVTYLLWFPFSVALGWWLTGALFARRYHRLQGVTLPSLLAQRFDGRTRLATSLSTMLYAIFVVLLEVYALSTVIQAILPGLTILQATIASVLVMVGSVAFSGLMGNSKANSMHSAVMLLSFTLSLIVLWNTVGGVRVAFDQVLDILPQVAGSDMDARTWLSATGMGWGVIGQLLLGKSGRLGGVSVVSNLSASCRSEDEAVKAFMLAGFVSGIPPFLAGLVGIFTAALLGPAMADMPAYSSIGLALVQVSPVLAGFLLAAVAAAILSSFGPITIVLSSVLIEDLVKPLVNLTEKQQRWLYPASIVLISVMSTVYLGVWGIKDILPFIYKTGFPTMIPPTLVALFGLYSKRVDARFAFWAIALGVPIALVWGLVLHEPWGIHNLYISLIIPLLILTAGQFFSKEPESSAKEWITKVQTANK